MVFPRSASRRNITGKRNGFLIGQLLLSVLIIMIIVLFGIKLYRDDLTQIKKYRLQTEVDNMKEIVSNTIVRIDTSREAAKSHAAELLETVAANVKLNSENTALVAEQIVASVSANKTGNKICALIEDGEEFTLFCSDNRTGLSVTREDAASILSKEAVRKNIYVGGCTIHLFTLQSDIDALVMESESKLIHKQRFSVDSYIWVNEVLNIEGGDNYAVRRIHPNLVETEGEYLSTSMQDIKGNFPYEVELEGIRENGEVVQQYYFKNKSNDEIGEKISYAAYYEPFRWIVAMGTPLDSLYSDIEALTEKRMVAFSIQIAVVCISVIVLLFFSMKRTISSLSNCAESAEQANMAKSIFLSNMSHDIRTPMNAIIGFTDIALKKNPNPDVRDCLNKIEESSEHLLSLINDVLDISRIESGKAKYSPVPIDLTVVADTVLDIVRGFMSGRDLKFNISRQKLENPYVLADPVRIREVLVNILSNAVKFTKDGGTITFDADYRKGDDEKHIIVKYVISDTGVGMSEEFKEHIFDEFAQEDSDARTRYSGTGLGMSITKRCVEMMGGTINVRSEKNVGTTITVELPLELVDGSAVQQQDKNAVRNELIGVHVLIAEDNDLNAEIATVQLEDIGMKVTHVADGKQAVEAFADNPAGTFDVVLMDIMMPKMNGYEATKEIRNFEGRPDGKTLPIIAMTANAFAEDVKASLEAGMDGHLSKPIDIDEVVKTIARSLNK